MEAIEEKRKRRHARAKELLAVRTLLRHFPKDYIHEIQQFVTDQALSHSRYMFIASKELREVGYCTHCRENIELTERPKHNAVTICPRCASYCIVKHDWRGHSKLIDKTYFHYYEKSKADPNAIICRGIFAYRDYAGGFRNTETHYETHTYYVFQMGSTAMFTNYKKYWYGMNQHGNCYDIRKSIYPRFIKYHQIKGITLDISIDSIREAVTDTPFQYSEWERFYLNYNLADGFVKYFALYAKYPSIEYIAKLGLERLIEARIQGEPTLSALNLSGKTLPQVLRMKLNKIDIQDLKQNTAAIHVNVLKIWQISKRDGSNLSLPEILKLDLPALQLSKIAKYTNIKKIIWYMEKQKAKRNGQEARKEAPRCTYSRRDILYDWRDYIADCQFLGFDLTQENVLFPGDLHKAHQNTTKQIQIQKNELLDEKIQKRLPKLEERFAYENEEFIIRPAQSTQELIDEGKALQHCVAAHYADKYAQGTTNILFIRRKREPEKPYYTVEVNNKADIMQTRGLKNCNKTKEVQAFVDEFELRKIRKAKEVKTA